MGDGSIAYGFIITLSWLALALFDYLGYIYFWQLKEYRLDRFRDFLHSKQGEEIYKDPRSIWRFLGAVILFIHPVPYIAISIIIAEILFILLKKRKFRRPTFTIKSLLIIITALGAEILLFQIFAPNLPLLFFLRFFILSLLVLLFFLPSKIIKRFLVARARRKLASYQDLLTIGITGSYGKSSVKEFTAHFLSSDYKVIKTPKNINSEIGIAQFILKTDFTGIDYFVCEMGAYTMGEIKLICSMVKPKIGILTTIGEQHLALFGSIKNIQTAKYELLRSIPEDGLVITNADNSYCTEFLKELVCKNIETCGKEEKNRPTCLLVNIKQTLKGIDFEAIYHGQRGEMSLPLLGAHQAYNATLAVMVAVNLETNPKHILKSAKTLPGDVQGSLKKYTYGKTTIIDDSYNSNPAGFRSALDVLSLFPKAKKRIVITRGMMELADQSNIEHEKIAQKIFQVCDELVLITPDFVDPIKSGAGPKNEQNIKYIFEQDELLKYVKNLKEIESVVLIENRIPSSVREEITSV